VAKAQHLKAMNSLKYTKEPKIAAILNSPNLQDLTSTISTSTIFRFRAATSKSFLNYSLWRMELGNFNQLLKLRLNLMS